MHKNYLALKKRFCPEIYDAICIGLSLHKCCTNKLSPQDGLES